MGESHHGELSPYHEHNDGTSGWDIQIKDDSTGRVDAKAHVSDLGGVGPGGSGLLDGAVSAIGSVFDSLFGSGKK